MLAIQEVIDHTMENFPGHSAGDFVVTIVEKGGSDRKFYRIRAGQRAMILVKYSGHKEENRHYVDIARFLAGCGLQVPHIYLHDAEEGLIWMQDLGERDLWAFRGEPWSVRRNLYESALSEVFKLHTVATRRLPGASLTLEREFSKSLYLWEQGYFFEHCLGSHFRLPEQEVRRLSSLPALLLAASRLAALPRVLVHRDFQSQNILIRDGSAWLIDFQGMRPGLPAYDLASLLYDPYVSMGGAERSGLLEFYEGLMRGQGTGIDGDFREVFDWCALQRLMQALGAYGFLGHQKDRTSFLDHIPAAKASLREVASRLDGLGDLIRILDALP